MAGIHTALVATKPADAGQLIHLRFAGDWQCCACAGDAPSDQVRSLPASEVPSHQLHSR